MANELSVYFDTDRNSATGCDLAARGVVGADRWVQAEVPGGTIVTSLKVYRCSSGVFSNPVTLPAGFPVGLNNGIDGSDVVELEVPASVLGITNQSIFNVHLVSTDKSAALAFAQVNGISIGSALPIPTLYETSLILLIVLLIFVARRYLPNKKILLASSILAGIAVARVAGFVADGQILDWIGESPILSQAANSGSSPSNDVRQLFLAYESGNYFIREDVTDLEQHSSTLVATISGPAKASSGALVNLTAAVTVGTASTFQWHQLSGPVVSFSSTASGNTQFVAPAVSAATNIQIELIVTQTTPSSQTAREIIDIVVTPDVVSVDAGSDIHTEISHNVSLHAVAHSTSNTLSYLWQQISGPSVVIQNATTLNPTFTAPSAITQMIFAVTATDSVNISDTDRVTVFVEQPHPPSLTAGGPVATESGKTVTLAATIDNGTTIPSGARVEWKQTKGPSVTLMNANTLNLSFTAPAVSNTTQLEFKVTLLLPSGAGIIDFETVAVHPSPGPAPLAVDAGKDVRIEFGDTISLHANVLARSTNTTQINWQQLSGCPVQSLTFPGVSGVASADIVLPGQPLTANTCNTHLEFQVTVTEGAQSATDTMTMSLFPAKVNATISDTAASQRGYYYSNETLHLIANLTAGKGPLSIQWAQVGTTPAVATLSNDTTAQVSITVPQAGDYTFKVDVTDALGNMATDTLVVSTLAPTTASITPPPVSTSNLSIAVHGGSTLSVNPSFELDNLTAQVSYSGEANVPTITWSEITTAGMTLTPANGGKDVSFTAPLVASSGTTINLQVEVNDGVKTLTQNVSFLIQDRPIQVSLSGKTDVYIGKQVTFHAQASGGYGPLNFTWNQISGPAVTINGSQLTNATFTPANTGTVVIELTVSDNNGNTASSQETIHINSIPAPPTAVANAPLAVDAGQDVSIEFGDTISVHANILSRSTNTTPVNWQQLSGCPVQSLTASGVASATIVLPSQPAPANTCNTQLEFQVTVTEGAQTATDTLTVSLFSATVDATISDTAASQRGYYYTNETLHLIANLTAGKGPLNIQWAQVGTTPAVATLSNDTTAQVSITVPQAGDYNFKVDITDALGNTASDTITVFTLAPTVPIITPPPVLGSNLSIAVHGGSTLTANQSFELDNLTAHVSYSGESNIPTITWSELTASGVTLTPANGGKDVSFTAPLVTSSGTTINLQVEVNDGVTTLTRQVSFLIQDRPIQVSLSGKTDVYIGKQVTLHAQASGGYGPLNLNWNQISGPAVTINGAQLTNVTFTSASAGTVVIELTVSDNNGNSASDRETIHVYGIPPLPTPAATAIYFPPPLTTLEGEQYTMTAVVSHGCAAGIITWEEVAVGSNPLLGISITANPSNSAQAVINQLPAVTSATSFKLKATLNGCGAAVSATTQAITIADRTLTAAVQNVGSAKTIKVGDTVHLSGSVVAGVPFGNLSYSWVTNGNGTLSNATTSSPTFVPTDNKGADVTLTITDTLGNTATASTHVQANYDPLSITLPADINAGTSSASNNTQSIHVDVSGGSGNYTITAVDRLGVLGCNYNSDDGCTSSVPSPSWLDLSDPKNIVVTFGPASDYGKRRKTRIAVTVADNDTGATAQAVVHILWDHPVLAAAKPTATNFSCANPPNSTAENSRFNQAVTAGQPVQQYSCTNPVVCANVAQLGDCPINKPYGFMTLDNKTDGRKIVTRSCADENEVIAGWYNQYSSDDKCTFFNFNRVYTLGFYCEYGFPMIGGNVANLRGACGQLNTYPLYQ